MKKRIKKKKAKRQKAREWPPYSLAGVRFSNEICDGRQVSAKKTLNCSNNNKYQLIVSSGESHWWTGE